MARAGHGWFLATTGRAAWGWSPERSWCPLPSTPWKIEEILVVDDGFLVVLDSGRKIGFWEPGASTWGWWLGAPLDARGSSSFFISARWRADGSLAVVEGGRSSERLFSLYRLDRSGPRRLRTFRLQETGELRGIEDRGPDPARLFCAQGAVTLPLGSGAPALELWIPLEGETVRVVDGHAFVGPDRFDRDSPVTRVFDLQTGRLTVNAWPAGPTLRPLQEAAARGERKRLGELLSFLESLPDAPDPHSELLALLEGPDGPIAAATTAGVFPRDPAVLTGTSGARASRFVSRDALLPLLFLTDPDGVAREAAAELVRGPDGQAVELAFSAAFGEAACERLADAVRGRTDLHVFYPEPVRRLFGRAGRPARELVVRLLGDDDPACRRLGSYAAGEPLLELAPALSGQESSPDGTLLRQRFLAALRDPEVGVRAAALHSCGDLELTGVLPEVLERLREDDTEARALAVRILLRLGDSGPTERTLLHRLLQSEEQEVRETIVEEFPRRWETGDIGVAIEALGDPSYRVRYEAAKAIPDHVEELDAGTFLAVLDAWLILALADKAAGTRGALGFSLGIDNLPEEVAKELGFKDTAEFDFDFSRQGPLLASLLVLSPGLTALEPREDWDGGGEDAGDLQSEPARRFGEAVPGILAVLPAVFEAQKEKGSVRALAFLSGQLVSWNVGHADRIAVVALLRALGQGGMKDDEADAPPERLSLAARLGRIGKRKAGLGACVERVRALGRGNGPLALAALLVLSLRDDLEARRELLRRIESGEVEPWWSVVSALALGGSAEERLALARRVARARAIPAGRKMQLLEALSTMDADLDPAQEPCLVDLAEEVAGAKGRFPFATRVGQAWTLAAAGRVRPVQALWEEGEAAGFLATGSRYELALSLARTGQVEQLDLVRARWADVRDRRAVSVFSLIGDLRDIPALEASKDAFVPAGDADAAMAAIRVRAGKD